jgi:hypothetical protein
LSDSSETNNEQVKQESARRTRRSFLVGGVAAAGAVGLYEWLNHAPTDGQLLRPLRKALNFNAAASRALFNERALAPTYPLNEATLLRVNGDFGLERDLKLDSWRLRVVGADRPQSFSQYTTDVMGWRYDYDGNGSTDEDKNGDKQEENTKLPPEFVKAFDDARKARKGVPMRGQDEAGESDSTVPPGTPGLLLTLDDIKKLPHHELVTQFKCIEGWSQIVHWGGVRLADFMGAYPPANNAQGKLPQYVYMETPEGNYYTGYTRQVCEHPQSLLVTEMHGKPLSLSHGAPLRLHMPTKYGYKQIKRIALIAYTDVKPDDYWTKLGYDWYAGL